MVLNLRSISFGFFFFINGTESSVKRPTESSVKNSKKKLRQSSVMTDEKKKKKKGTSTFPSNIPSKNSVIYRWKKSSAGRCVCHCVCKSWKRTFSSTPPSWWGLHEGEWVKNTFISLLKKHSVGGLGLVNLFRKKKKKEGSLRFPDGRCSINGSLSECRGCYWHLPEKHLGRADFCLFFKLLFSNTHNSNSNSNSNSRVSLPVSSDW